MEEVNNPKTICWLGIHSYKVHSTHPTTNVWNVRTGLAIVNRCVNCGKLKTFKVQVIDNH